MELTGKLGAIATIATLGVSALAPVAASASQTSKNQWRDLGIGAAVIAGYGLLNHNNTATVLGAAGAAYSANRYEQDRHNQSVQNNWYSNRHQDNSSRYHRDRVNYYWYQGHEYGQNLDTGNRFFVR